MAATEISERHRHRFEFNREFEEILTAHGLRITGETPDGTYVEICEIEDHPWYLGCQFHPEFKSKPLEPHPLFSSFIGAALPVPRAPHRRQEAPLLPEPEYIGDERPNSAIFPRPRAARPDRRSLRHRKRRARQPDGRRHLRHRRGRRFPLRLQSLVRQSQPHQPEGLSRTGPRRRAAHPRRPAASAAFRSSPTSTNPRRPARPRKLSTSCRSRRSSAARPICCSKPAARAASSTSRKASSSRRTTSITRPKKWLPPATARWS